MKKFLAWISNNKEMLIKLTLLLPIIFSIVISINHVIVWYLIANPSQWAIFLSIGVEVAAVCTLLSLIFAKPGWHIYSLFIVVTIIQIIGNVFYSYQFIDQEGQLFVQWKELMKVITNEETWGDDKIKFWLAVMEGMTAPLLSLLSLHLLSKFELNNNPADVITKEDDSIRNSSIIEPQVKKPLYPKVPIKQGLKLPKKEQTKKDGYVYEDVEQEVKQEEKTKTKTEESKTTPTKTEQIMPRIKIKK